MSNISVKLTILQRILILFLTVSLISSLLYMYFGYTINSHALINGIDKRLLIAAATVDHVVEPEFYDNCSHENAVPNEDIDSLPLEDERRILVDRIRVLQKSADLLYLYSVMKDEQGRYFLPFGSNSGYGTIYDNPSEEIIRVLEHGGSPSPQTIHDPFYGQGRAVLTRQVTPSGRFYLIGAEASLDEVRHVKLSAFLTFLSISVVSFLGVAAVGFLLARRISNPIHRLNDFVLELRKSDFSPQMQMPAEMLKDAQNAKNETLLLAEGIDKMQKELVHYVDELKTTTQSKERAESELRVAGDIQLRMLPTHLPKDFPVDLATFLKPAREAGGDLYDFIPLDDHRLFFAVGDVSGKGMPAALFMAMALTLIRSAIRNGMSLQDAMIWTNNNLCVANDSCTFVTLIIAIFDASTGEITYCNGGHNPPVLRRRNGETAFTDKACNMLVGFMEQDDYILESLTIEAGDSFILYSDGVTEAMNNKNELFDEERLLESVRSVSLSDNAQAVLSQINHDVAEHVKEYPQSDDITILVLKRLETEV